jgi:CSLREA domain-containing protein
VVAVAAALPAHAGAAIYRVTTTADTVDADVHAPACADAHHRCSLRAAVMQANFHPGADTILLGRGTYRLTRPGDDDTAIRGDLDLTDNVTITGKGSSRTIIDGNGAATGDRVLQVLPGAVTTTITGVTIRHGKKTSTADEGGGLRWDGGGGRLTMRDVVLVANRAFYGGGMYLIFSGSTPDTVTLDHVVLRGNVSPAATAGGLGVTLFYGSMLQISNSRISGNSAFEGGGLYIQNGAIDLGPASARISSSVVDGNRATHDAGIEIANAPLTVRDTLIRGNVATGAAGGIGNAGTLSLQRSTLAGNRAGTHGGGLTTHPDGTSALVNATVTGNTGGGIYGEAQGPNAAADSLVNVTVSGNAGGGIATDAGAVASTHLTNTLVAHGPVGADCSAPFGGTANLDDDVSCGFGGPATPDLHLGPLGDYGGPTPTEVPLAGSPAVDAGTNAGAPAGDQRGIARPQGIGYDIGAVEVCQTPPQAPAALAPRGLVHARRATLDWSDVGCVQTYAVVIRRRRQSGPVVQTVTGLHVPSLRTRTLRHHTRYYWQVTAIGDRGSAATGWQRFTVR